MNFQLKLKHKMGTIGIFSPLEGGKRARHKEIPWGLAWQLHTYLKNTFLLLVLN